MFGVLVCNQKIISYLMKNSLFMRSQIIKSELLLFMDSPLLYIFAPQISIFCKISKASASCFYILPNQTYFPFLFQSHLCHFQVSLNMNLQCYCVIGGCSHCTLFCVGVAVTGKEMTLFKSTGSIFPDMFHHQILFNKYDNHSFH